MTEREKLERVAEELKDSGGDPSEPLWGGPVNEGITFSLLSEWIMCPERFRIKAILGYEREEDFVFKIEYGNMWHLCEEVNENGGDWEEALESYARSLAKIHPASSVEITKWFNVCKVQFPVYLDYWEREKDPYDEEYSPIFRERVFGVSYPLPSGRKVFLKGKWDGLDLFPNGEYPGLYLREHKTKGQVEASEVETQLRMDLQTMLYTVALERHLSSTGKRQLKKEGLREVSGERIQGVIYNVVRRALSGGKGSIVRHKEKVYKRKDGSISKVVPEETWEHYYERLATALEENAESDYNRWRSVLLPGDVERFKREVFHPLLERLVDWYEHVTTCPDLWSCDRPEHRGVHWRRPYGLYRVLDEGGETIVDDFLNSGSIVGLRRSETLFPELEE